MINLLQKTDLIGFELVRTLLSILWQSSIVFLVVLILTYLLRHQRAKIRHIIWVCALLAVPALPVLTWMLSAAGTPKTLIPVMPVYSSAHIVKNIPPQMPENAAPSNINPVNPNQVSKTITPPVTDNLPANINNFPIVIQKPENKNILSQYFYPWAFLTMLLAAGFLFFIYIIINGRIRTRKWLLKSILITDNRILSVFHDAAVKLNLKKDFIVSESNEIEVPLTIGIIHNVILLPKNFTADISEQGLKAVAVHELSHIKRHDALIFSIVAVIRAVFFFHPFVWISSRFISELAEYSCDDVVVEIIQEPVSYAKILTNIAENLPKYALQPEIATGILFSKGIFFRRVEAILSKHRKELRSFSKMVFAGTILVAVVTLVGAAALPLGDVVEKTEISGKVMYNSAPVTDAEIFLNNALEGKIEKIGKTDSRGFFKTNIPKSSLCGESFIKPAIIAYSPKYAAGWALADGDLNNLCISLTDKSITNGYITDNTGKPVAGAKVSLYVAGNNYYGVMNILYMKNETFPPLSASTDDKGFFEIKNIPLCDGMAVYRIEKTGYADEYVMVQPSMFSCNLKKSLKPGGTIKGRVYYSDAKNSAKHIKIIAKNSNLYLNPTKEVFTGNDGSYSLSELNGGIYNLYVIPDTDKDFGVTVKENVFVNEGKITENLNISLADCGFIEGKVFEENSGNPVPCCLISYQDSSFREGEPSIIHTITDKNGNYSIKAAPGFARVTAYAPNGYINEGIIKRELNITAGKTETMKDIILKKGIELKGIVRTGDGKSVENAVIVSSGDCCVKVFSGPNGEFKINGFRNGSKTTLTVMKPEAKLRGKVDLEVKPGSKVEVLINKYETTTLKGKISDDEGKPIPDASIVLIQRYEDPSIPPQTVSVKQCNKSGEFSFDNLIVGEIYSLFTKAEGFNSPNIGFSAQLGENEIKVTSNTVLNKEIVLQKLSGWLGGKIIDEKGNPVVGAVVSVGIGSANKSAISNSNGEFKIEGTPGKVIKQINIDHQNFGHYFFNYVRANTDNKFVLAKGNNFLSGKVFDPEGNPLENAYVGLENQEQESGLISMGSTTDKTGNFSLKDITSQSVDIYVRHPSFGSKKFGGVTVNKKDAVLKMDPVVKKPEVVKKNTVSPDSYDTILLKGIAPVKIDGDLSDWSNLDIKPAKLTDVNPYIIYYSVEKKSFNAPETESDLSAEFWVFGDSNYLYAAFSVTDDDVLFTNQQYNNCCGADDTVLLWFFNNSQQKGVTYINVGSESNGKTTLDGREPISFWHSPYLMSAMGVQAALKKRPGGYDAEYAIPWSYLNLGDVDKETFVGIFARVYDRDASDGNSCAMQVVEWPLNGEDDNVEIKFVEKTIPGETQSNAQKYKSQELDKIVPILKNIKAMEFDKAEKQLKSAGNGKWVKPLLAQVYQQSGKYDEAVALYLELIKSADDNPVRWWYQENIMDISQIYANQGKNDKAIMCFNSITDQSFKYATHWDPRIELARIYLMNGDYVKAEQSVQKFLNSDALENNEKSYVYKNAQDILRVCEKMK